MCVPMSECMYASACMFQQPHCMGMYSGMCPGHACAYWGNFCVHWTVLGSEQSPSPQGLLSSLQFNLILSAVSLLLASSPDVAIKQMQQLSRVPQTAIPPGSPSRS